MNKIENVTVWEDKTISVRYSGRTRIIRKGEKIPATVFEKMDSCENPIHGVSVQGKKFTVYK